MKRKHEKIVFIIFIFLAILTVVLFDNLISLKKTSLAQEQFCVPKPKGVVYEEFSLEKMRDNSQVVFEDFTKYFDQELSNFDNKKIPQLIGEVVSALDDLSKETRKYTCGKADSFCDGRPDECSAYFSDPPYCRSNAGLETTKENIDAKKEALAEKVNNLREAINTSPTLGFVYAPVGANYSNFLNAKTKIEEARPAESASALLPCQYMKDFQILRDCDYSSLFYIPAITESATAPLRVFCQ